MKRVVAVLALAAVAGVVAFVVAAHRGDRGGSAQQGQPFTLRTHCGVVSATIKNELWLATPPLTDGSGNPPAGWGNPSDTGTLRFLSSTEAEFESKSGQVAHFVRAKLGEKDPAAGCA